MLDIFFLDNQDSFSYNLVDELAQINPNIKVYRNSLPTSFIYQQITAGSNQAILVISPGPGKAQKSGCLPELLKLTIGTMPILGICLGMQAIVENFGGKVDKAPVAVHGKTSVLKTSKHPIFKDLPPRLTVARYHSLAAVDVIKPLNVIAHYKNIPMIVEHDTLPIMGFQFHPESVLTTMGKQLLKQSIDYLATKH